MLVILYILLQFNLGNSWWPFYMSFSIFSFLFSILIFFFLKSNIFLFLAFFFLILNIFFWYQDLCRESMFIGSQNLYMISAMKFGMIFFILSEFMFFISFFWSYAHFMFLFSGEMGLSWPPMSMTKMNYISLPLLNTMILLFSGATLTLSHMEIFLNYMNFQILLLNTIFLSFFFLTLQLWEYIFLDFLWSDSSYGSIFFLGTGFHGIHVLVGSMLLIIVFIRSFSFTINKVSLFFEVSVWYWHFVDVIWLFLYLEFYWWPNL